jgi:phosphoribosylglycinamide formyltransferase-1
MAAPLPIAVLISGGGTTLRNLLEKCDQGELDIDVRLVISSTPRAGGLAFASSRRIPTLVIEQRKYASPETFRDAVFGPCRDAGVQLVVMGGYLKHVPIPPDFENRVVNIHPALIPSFCGKGMYGIKVHEAVLEYGAKLTGCTVHFVDNEYDHGPILLQRAVAVADDDTPEALQKRVFATECEALPEAIRLIAADRVVVNGRRVSVR